MSNRVNFTLHAPISKHSEIPISILQILCWRGSVLRLHPTSACESATHDYPQLLRRLRCWECQATWGSLASMLCHMCLSIFEGDLPEAKPQSEHLWYPHHPGQESLSSSAREGCQICVSLWEHIDRYFFSRELGFAEPFTMHRPLTECVDEALRHHSKFAWMFQISFRVGESYSYITFHILPSERSDETVSQNFIHSTDASDGTESSARKRIMSQWLTDCIQNHPDCRSSSSQPWLPTRLLDLGHPSSQVPPKLIITQENISFQGLKSSLDEHITPPYITLSYCWGQHPPFRLLKSNVLAMKEGIAMEHLPKTILHAVWVAKSLSVRFLWIDCLCILQDSEEDWLKESALMAKVYGMAHCNIAATGATDSNEGLFFKREPKNFHPSRLTVRWGGLPQMQYLVVENSDGWSDRFEHYPLNRRAWVLQERFLSTRILHFTLEELIWECRKHAVSESFPHGLPNHIQEYHSLRNQVLNPSSAAYSSWSEVVRLYSQGKLTFPSDKLVAISGMASEMRHRGLASGRFLAGLWEAELPRSLLWIRGDMYEVAYENRRPLRYRAPSWSWASLDCPIDNHWTIPDHRREVNLAVVQDIRVDATNSDGTGQVLGGYLSIHGPLGLVTWERKTHWIMRINEAESFSISSVRELTDTGDPVGGLSHRFSINEWNDAIFDAFEEDQPSETLWCLPIHTGYRKGISSVDFTPESNIYGLLLDQVKDGYYRRVGAFSISLPDSLVLTRLDKRTITLV